MPRRSPRASQSDRRFPGAVFFPAPGFVPDPGGLAKAYAALFGRKGGRYFVGDARTLEQSGGGGVWRRRRLDHRARSRGGDGPWSDQVFRHLAIRSRLRQARLSPAPEASRQCRAQSSRARYRSGLSAGADEPRHSPHHRREFARRDAPPTPVQVERALPRAHSCFRWARRSMPRPGRARGRACRTCCR